MPRKNGVERSAAAAAVIEEGGGVTELARRLCTKKRRITKAAVSRWVVVPTHWIRRVQKVTGLSLVKIRPDLYERKGRG